jgi:hypothetical protein
MKIGNSTLTRRGERIVVLVSVLVFLALMGLVGGIETGTL